MDEILINLEVPSVQESYDIFMPGDLSIGILAQMSATGVADMTNGRYMVSGKEMLMKKDSSILFNPEQTLLEYGVIDGTKLILV